MDPARTDGPLSVLVADAGEDSVDIYEGLEDDFDNHTKTSPPGGSKLTESMDLYEELVREEEQSKEHSFTELKSRFHAAQIQIQDLMRRLGQMEVQNSALSSENSRLKKNISALLRTARQEVKRKDEEIQRLNQRSERNYHHPQTRISQLQNPVPSHTSSSTSRPSPPIPPPSAPPPALPPRDHQRESRGAAVVSRVSPQGLSKPQCELTDRQLAVDKQKAKHREGHQQKQPDSTDRRHRGSTDLTKDSQRNRTHRDEERRHDSRSNKSSRSDQSVEDWRRLESDKTTSPQNSHKSHPEKKAGSGERRMEKDTPPSNSEHSTGHASREHRERKNRSQERHCKPSDPKEQRRVHHHTERHRDPKDKEGERRRDHHRKEDRREGESKRTYKRSSQSESSRDRGTLKTDGPSKDAQEGKEDVPGLQKPEKGLGASGKVLTVKQKANSEDSSPKRKLCFMETLNLTLSPIKKPLLAPDNDQDNLKSGKAGPSKTPDQEHFPPNIEEMCVIDEVENSDSETHPDVSQTAPDSPTAPRSKSTEDMFSSSKAIKVKWVQPTPGRSSAPAGTPEGPARLTEQLQDEGGNGSDWEKASSDHCKPASASRPPATNHLQALGTEAGASESSPKPKAAEVPSPTRAQVEHTATSEALTSAPPPPVSTSPSPEPIHGPQKCRAETGSASSPICMDSLPHEGLSLSEAILVLTRAPEDTGGVTAEPSSPLGCTSTPSKGGGATEDKTPAPRSSEGTPKKAFIRGASQEKNSLCSSLAPLLHDEDSMMRTLSNIKRIPDAISPLRSPVRITRRGLLRVNGKPGHVKSLQKDFSGAPSEAASTLDVNKENKQPSSPVNSGTSAVLDRDSDMLPSLSDTDLEEGELVSESDEGATESPAPPNKTAKPTEAVRKKPGPKTFVRRRSKAEHGETKGTSETADTSAQSPKTRFKTVCPAATKASFSSVKEVMETFRLLRGEIRRKYMKLHKTFPKKSFYGVINNFQESFLEFVSGAQFGQICDQTVDLKSRLKKLITSVFTKVSNNGIVKRIFEQQAVDMKQKLWDFVDGQITYLFKDIEQLMKGLCKAKKGGGGDDAAQQAQREERVSTLSLTRTRSCTFKTGLGSRGKDIRISQSEEDGEVEVRQCTQTVVEVGPPHSFASSPEKKLSSVVVSQNGALTDRAEYELLTEQQASSLTFNLVRDSQMGEIFKCLLQGSDLLDGGMDNGAWALSTPRKDGDRFVALNTPLKESPSRLVSPSKLCASPKMMATWSALSPCRGPSARSKDHLPLLHPALFDESCQLEVPSENRATHKVYSILAEDLAVSLTIPSPLKSDSHLSFLQTPSLNVQRVTSTPESVISAHISEDALMDGEDATEQDIHLALDTDNSSCASSGGSVMSSPLATPFVFKPDLPMQALVMEKSNDHFIVKIRQTNADTEVTLTAEESLSHTLTEENKDGGDDVSVKDGPELAREDHPDKRSLSQGASPDRPHPAGNRRAAGDAQHGLSESRETTNPSTDRQHQSLTMGAGVGAAKRSTEPLAVSPQSLDVCKHDTHKSTSPTQSGSRTTDCGNPDGAAQSHPGQHDCTQQGMQARPSQRPGDLKVSDTEKEVVVERDPNSSAEEKQRSGSTSRKRKKHQKKQKAKKQREEGDTASRARKAGDESTSSASLSPNSLSAKNVVRKKGEVVMAWTRDEDRAILIDLKRSGASRDTFSALSERLNKPSEQIAHRFHQLMKLFKKQEKTDP